MLNIRIFIIRPEIYRATLVSILRAGKLAVEAIFLGNANLISANTAIYFMIQSLRKYAKILSNQFQTALFLQLNNVVRKCLIFSVLA